MAKSALGLGLALLGGGALLAMAAGKKNKLGAPTPGPNLTPDEKGRVEAALASLRALTTAKPKDRANLIAAFQHAARIPVHGSLDDLTMQAAEAVTQGQIDGDAIMAGLKSLVAASPPVPKDQPAIQPPPETVPAEQATASLAEVVARSLEVKGTGYDRNAMASFQRKAGLKPDGLYGPNTRTALLAAGIEDRRLPPIMVGGPRPAHTPPPASPPTTPPGGQPATPTPAPGETAVSLKTLAEVAARNLELAGPKYDHAVLASFQKRSPSLKPDGLYGPKTRAALVSAGIEARRLPAPNFAGWKGVS